MPPFPRENNTRAIAIARLFVCFLHQQEQRKAEEFRQALAVAKLKENVRGKIWALEDALSAADTEGRGALTLDQFHQTLVNASRKFDLEREDLGRLVAWADFAGDGNVIIKDVVEACKGATRATSDHLTGSLTPSNNTVPGRHGKRIAYGGYLVGEDPSKKGSTVRPCTAPDEYYGSQRQRRNSRLMPTPFSGQSLAEASPQEREDRRAIHTLASKIVERGVEKFHQDSMRELFRRFDRQHRGRISVEDLQEGCRELNINVDLDNKDGRW